MISKERETELVNEVRGKHAAEGVVAARRGNEKYSNYAIYILDNDQTVYVNLDKGTSHIQESQNKKHIKKYRAAEERKASRAQEKADREQEKTERAAKPKAEPKAKAQAKPKAPKVVKATPRRKITAEGEARIQQIQEERGCTRGNAVRQFNNEQAIKEADAEVTPKAEPKKAVVDPLAQATPVAEAK